MERPTSPRLRVGSTRPSGGRGQGGAPNDLAAHPDMARTVLKDAPQAFVDKMIRISEKDDEKRAADTAAWSQMKTLRILFRLDLPAEEARHRSGRRRSGLPDPACPCCGAAMFCIFSLDGSDEMLRDSPLPVQPGDYDLFCSLRLLLHVRQRPTIRGTSTARSRSWRGLPRKSSHR